MLETLVHDLRCELKQARSSTSATISQGSTHAPAASPGPTVTGGSPSRAADLSSTFWTRVGDELAGFRDGALHDERDQDDMPLEGVTNPLSSVVGSGHASLSSQPGQSSRTSTYDTSSLFPLASQIPYLLEVFTERVHSITAVPHIPSLKKVVRRNQTKSRKDLSSSEEALLFAVFYAAICSLDDDEVTASFNATKTELATTYRRGLEVALAAADYLSNPSDTLLQALLVYLTLARLHDSSKYLWMMTGLVIRMARFLRYNEDGADSRKIGPFQAEMRRRIWWNLCALDMRATEDQGTELAIPHGSFTTKLPSNLEDNDLWPEMERTPSERSNLTSLSLLRLCSKVARGTQKMIASGSSATIESHIRLLDDLAQELDRDYFSIANQSEYEAYLAAAGTMRVFLARLTLLAFLPALFSSPEADFSAEIRNKMFIAAIEIAELNHALNSHPSCLPWRWVYQTQQHWHAVVFILIEVCRRPWSATVERAWIALQSPWLLPARAASYSNPSVWVPLKALMAKARDHREQELLRLRHDRQAAAMLQRDDEEQMPIPSSSVTFPMFYDEEMLRKRWRQLLDEAAAVTSNASATIGSKVPQDSASFDGHGRSMPSGSSRTQAAMPGSQHRHYDFVGNAPVGGSMQEPGHHLATLSNLDTFINADSTMDAFGSMDDLDFSDFDWNSWFETASGAL